MEEGLGNTLPFKYPFSDFLFTVVGLFCFVLDMVLDVWAVASFYLEGEYVYMGMLVFLLLGSSLLVQAFSLLWYLCDKDGTETRTGGLVKNLRSLKILHVFQMGVFVRYAGVVSVSICGFCYKKRYMEGDAVFLSHDLSLLRLFETFSESAPQLVLMVTIIIGEGSVDLITILKAIGSASAISVSVTMYHRSLRSFLPSKAKQGWLSSVVYFLWNLLLIGPRVAAVSLFASAFPCYIAAHFLCSWMVLFLFASQLNTDLMDSIGGERLYQATIGLIWYFSWFHVTRGTSRWISTIYHTWIAVDIVILCGLWIWQTKESPPYFDLPLEPCVIFVVNMLLYFSGLGLKVIYYKYCHPKCTLQIEPDTDSQEGEDEVDFRCMVSSQPKPSARVNKRMRNLAETFYS
ncbi:XK-related protein 8 [Esox lucius]|uniref:XK-related protein n=1 Tax=Esox lucius TaxID=8010 RepID=A0AAY5K6Q8_ESOLU|nr:XK-related protein 8 [Esox lucius]